MLFKSKNQIAVTDFLCMLELYRFYRTLALSEVMVGLYSAVI